MIGKNIKKARLLAGLSQTQLGELVGKGVSTISEWESDKRSPDVEMLPLLSSVLNVSMAYLMGITDDSKFGKTAKEEIITLSDSSRELLVAYNVAEEWKKKAVRRILGMEEEEEG